jgi:hypothetical protein
MCYQCTALFDTEPWQGKQSREEPIGLIPDTLLHWKHYIKGAKCGTTKQNLILYYNVNIWQT